MSVNTRNNIVTDGLVTYLDALSNISYVSGSNTWNDLLKINNGTLVSASYSRDAGGSLTFSGSTAFVTMSSEFNLANWTYNGWYKYNYEPLNSTIFVPLASSGSKSGQITWSRGLFQGVTILNYDTESNSIFMGTFGAGEWDTIPRWFALKLDSTGSLITNFNTNYTVGQAIEQHQIRPYSGSLYTCGTNLGFFQKRDKDTGNIITQTTAGGVSDIGSYFIIDESEKKVYHMGTSYTTAFGLSRNYLCKFDLDSLTVDTVFDTSGGLNTAPFVRRLYLTSDKYLYAVGTFTSYKSTGSNHIIKLDQSGNLDPNFKTGVGFNSTAPLVSIMDSQNRLICAGGFTSYSGSASTRIIRINPDGTRDTSFNVGAGFNNNPANITIQPDDKVIVVGRFSTYSGSSAPGIVRINPDGTRDTSFNVGTGINTNLTEYNIFVQPDSKILLTYSNLRIQFPTYNGTPFRTLIRINPDGTVDNTFNTGSGFTDTTSRAQYDIRVRNTSSVLTTLTALGVIPSRGFRASPDLYKSFFNKWNNLAITKDSTNTLRFYNNGILMDTIPVDTSSYQNLDLQVDRLSNNGTSAVNMIYNRALSQNEITQNYNTLKTRFDSI